MAKSRKQQRAAKAAVGESGETMTKYTRIAVPEVVVPAKPVPTPARVRPAKVRHVRPARQKPAEKLATLARGTSIAARKMSAGVAKGIATPAPTGAPSGPTHVAPSPAAGSGST